MINAFQREVLMFVTMHMKRMVMISAEGDSPAISRLHAHPPALIWRL